MAKFPYKNYSEKELARIEANFFCIQLGGDFLMDEDLFAFTKKETANFYNNTLSNLINLYQDGSERDKKYAIDLIGSLRIVPFKLH